MLGGALTHNGNTDLRACWQQLTEFDGTVPETNVYDRPSRVRVRSTRFSRHECASERGDLLATASTVKRLTTTSAVVDGSGRGVSVRLVRLLLLTTPAGGSSVTVL